MFIFNNISSTDMEVIIEEEEHFLGKASQRYVRSEIEGRNGALFEEHVCNNRCSNHHRCNFSQIQPYIFPASFLSFSNSFYFRIVRLFHIRNNIHINVRCHMCQLFHNLRSRPVPDSTVIRPSHYDFRNVTDNSIFCNLICRIFSIYGYNFRTQCLCQFHVPF